MADETRISQAMRALLTGEGTAVSGVSTGAPQSMKIVDLIMQIRHQGAPPETLWRAFTDEWIDQVLDAGGMRRAGLNKATNATLTKLGNIKLTDPKVIQKATLDLGRELKAIYSAGAATKSIPVEQAVGNAMRFSQKEAMGAVKGVTPAMQQQLQTFFKDLGGPAERAVPHGWAAGGRGPRAAAGPFAGGPRKAMPTDRLGRLTQAIKGGFKKGGAAKLGMGPLTGILSLLAIVAMYMSAKKQQAGSEIEAKYAGDQGIGPFTPPPEMVARQMFERQRTSSQLAAVLSQNPQILAQLAKLDAEKQVVARDLFGAGDTSGAPGLTDLMALMGQGGAGTSQMPMAPGMIPR